MNRFSRGGVFALGLVAAGCASSVYPDVPPGVPAATLVFAKGDEAGLGFSPIQAYAVSEDGVCDHSKTAAKLLWTTASSASARVGAGHLVIVSATTAYIYTKGVRFTAGVADAVTDTLSCSSSANFVAEQGHTYNVTQVAPFRKACHFVITDAATGQTPATLHIDNPATCIAAAI